MREKDIHRAAYEFYFRLGEKRTNKAVGDHFKVSEQSVCKWRRVFNWDKRLEQRAVEIASEVERKTNKTIIETKAEYREDIKRALNIVKRALNQAIKEDEKGQPIVNLSPLELQRLIRSMDILMKADLLMIGEATEIGEDHFTFEVVGVDVGRFPKPE